MDNSILTEQISEIRKFNRFFTRKIGVLRERLLHSPYSLTESRIIFELANREKITASDLCSELGLDAGYLSRILNKFEQQDLIVKVRSEEDKRQRLISLTPEGKEAFSLLNQRSIDEVSEMLEGLSTIDRSRLLDSMHTIEGILDSSFKYADPFFLRPHEAGDIGWVIQQHGRLYKKTYGWDESFEGFVAQICSDFIQNYKPEKEKCLIAEMQGENVGSVFCVQKSEEVAQLRMLIVTPKARGLGLGTQLVKECIRFARNAGYKKMVLWTNDILGEARRIYQKHGFELVEENNHHSFGKDLVGQNWELML